TFKAGAVAGLVVDVALFPLDTLKTRLQSQFGFWKSGGFRRIYKGIGPTAIGSAPCAAVFFTTYNGLKYSTEKYVTPEQKPLIHMFAAAIGEGVSCIIRVPTEIVKQRRQACVAAGSSLSIILDALNREGIRGLYNGFGTTVLRDVPFAILQFPLWEFFKLQVRHYKHGESPTPFEGAICGALAGSLAGAVTTPLDVIKTRIMLSVGHDGQISSQPPVLHIIKHLYREKGIFGFFSGFIPRVMWIFFGGAIFFGVYEEACFIIAGDRHRESNLKKIGKGFFFKNCHFSIIKKSQYEV
ncbi:hypothetical protein AAG570_004509, partial [Ranatra chinensis]